MSEDWGLLSAGRQLTGSVADGASCSCSLTFAPVCGVDPTTGQNKWDAVSEDRVYICHACMILFLSDGHLLQMCSYLCARIDAHKADVE